MRSAAAAARAVLGARLPTVAGQLDVPGLDHPVTIRRDRHGIPHVDAAGDGDAWFGLGFCQGQDRTFQLEGLLRVVRGTLADLVGPDGIAIDRLSRRVGFRRAGEASLAALDRDVRLAVERFAAGVTAGAAIGRRRRPPGLALLRRDPTPWDPADVAGMLVLQSFLLASNWDQELARLQILRLDGPEALLAVDPGAADDLPVTDPPGHPAGRADDRLSADLAVDRLSADISALREVAGHGGASNNWAISPGRTATGRPLLANDPHLAPLLPPHWYLCHVSTPRWSVAGAALAGTPGIAAGHNGFAAWGVTAGLVDNTDLYLEEVGPDARSVRRGHDFVQCHVLAERIEVRGGPPVTEEVLVTPHGPVIGPALTGELGAVSIQATWLRPGPARGVLALHSVRSFADFRAAFRDWPALPLNVVYADERGTIGWQLAGAAPVRRSGHGLLPRPGADPDAAWEDGIVPFAEMPHAADPECGWLATANNQPLPDGIGPYLGADWLDGYRVARIGQVLAGRDDWDLDAVAALQLDQLALPWREIREVVLAAAAGRPGLAAARDLLAGWDGVLGAGSPAGAVYGVFMAEVTNRVVAARAPRAARWAMGRGFTPLVPNTLFALRAVRVSRLLREQPAGWFDGGWDDQIADALEVVTARLRARSGPDPTEWSWGGVRPLTLRHPLGTRRPLDRVFNLGPFPWGGDANTVAQASPDPVDPMRGTTVAIASLRMVVDVGAWERTRFALPGGQSGNPFSPHYDDLLPHWRAGTGVPIAWDEPAVVRATVETLELVPS